MRSKQLPAKVLKRIGQVRRLGTRGLLRTAYVRALGPTVYSVSDTARIIAVALHRRKSLTRALPVRLDSLRERLAATGTQPGRHGTKLTFGKDLGKFVRTLEALTDLAAAGCAVPKVATVDWAEKSITILPVGGTRFFNTELGRSALEDALLAIHRAGYVLGEVSEGDVLVSPDGTPVITDLEHAMPLAGVSRDMSVYLRDIDRRSFNDLFGTTLLTAAQLRRLLSPNATIPHNNIEGCFSQVYAPVVIRDDIRWGRIWNTDLGNGRWNFIMKDHLPIPVGGSVLDLGSNNGFNPLQMLRAGAAAAVGIELDEAAVQQANFLRSAFEWLDNRSYDFRCIHGSQADMPTYDLPKFDMVTAFCSLYYLPDAEIRELVRYIRTRTDLLVLQCNVDRLIDRGGNEETFRKASVEYAVEVLEQAGFTSRKIIAPPGYSRPLVIGRAA